MKENFIENNHFKQCLRAYCVVLKEDNNRRHDKVCVTLGRQRKQETGDVTDL